MPSLLALVLCEACSQPQAQVPAQPATLAPSAPSAREGKHAATPPPADTGDDEVATHANHSSNRQPRTDAR